MQYGVEHKTFRFRELLQSQPSKMDIVVTFLAILELMKIGNINIIQEEVFGDIIVTYLKDSITPIDDIVFVDE